MIEGLFTQTMFGGRMDADVVYTVILLLLVLLAAVSYAVRVFLKGRAHYARVDKQGGSALLRKELMEAGYWALQPVARLLIFFHVTPNMISYTSLFFAVAGAVCLAFGHFGFGAGFATVSAFMDTLDGIVARETGVASEAGEVLDCAIDRYGEFLFLSGLIIYYRSIPTLLVLCLVALAGSYMVSYTSVLAGSLGVKPPSGSMRRPERALFLTLGALLSPITISLFEVERPYGIAIAHPMIAALVFVGVISNLSAVERFWQTAKALRKNGTDRPAAPPVEESAVDHESASVSQK